MIKNKLMNKKSSQFREECVNNTDVSKIIFGNCDLIKSEATIRKVASEAYAHLDRCKDDIIDVILMRRENENYRYIQDISEPFDVHLFSKEQIDVLKHLKRNVVLYLDATGKVVRPSGSF